MVVGPFQPAAISYEAAFGSGHTTPLELELSAAIELLQRQLQAALTESGSSQL
jgi:hypothetical protein